MLGKGESLVESSLVEGRWHPRPEQVAQQLLWWLERPLLTSFFQNWYGKPMLSPWGGETERRMGVGLLVSCSWNPPLYSQNSAIGNHLCPQLELGW